MEVREFKKWLIDNGFEDDELYQESLKCYQVEAYKAAYIFSYLANHKYIARLAIDYRGTPSNFMSDCPENKQDIKEARWEEKIKSLQNEDEWEQTVNDILIQAKDTNNVFRLPDKIKQKYSHMRSLRNNAAHAKDRLISESTVLELWNEIQYTNPYFVINGTIDAWLDKLDKVVKYSNNDSKYLDELLDKFNNFSVDNKSFVIKSLIKKYLIVPDYDEEYPNIIVTLLSKVFQDNKYSKQISKSFSEEEEIYLYICTGKYKFHNEMIKLFTSLEILKKNDKFRYFCEEFPNNFWKFIDEISGIANSDTLINTLLFLLKQTDSRLLDINFSESRFLESNDLFFEEILAKIDDLYYYTMTYSGQKRHQTSTFDYLKFHYYINYIRYITYRVSIDSNLRQNNKVEEFIERFKTLMTSDYSDDYFYSLRQMQKRIKEINEIYTIVK
ncbi:hypothetical protein FOA39_03630 [Streptococcus cristatus]|uniref:hypothetical protein n=1 Tax=Streptococcus cristatus TaxID=45634 RepID=UPI001652CC37|nr:hypothetical protein [Streptococcus cristatus]MBC6977033.1 hypothetical protein [Streptococcus cristatus]